MKRSVIEFIVGLPIIVLGYFFLDYLYCVFISHSAFSFDIKGGAIAVVVWLAVVVFSHIKRNNKENISFIIYNNVWRTLI